jgi:hypothetical protein
MTGRAQPPADQPVVVTLSEIEPTQVRWLWDKRIPRGKLMIIAGEPGCGKSTLIMECAAHITTGTQWPDGSLGCSGDVLLLAAEDNPGDTIRPRLNAAGADASRVHLLKAIQTHTNGEERNFDLTRDLKPLEFAVEKYRPTLVCIDPLNAYLGDTDEWRDTSVKKVLIPLVRLAEDYECAIVGVTHLSKSQGRTALHRVLGSIGYTGTARHVMAVAADPEDHDLRYFLWVKSNAGPPSETLGFRIVEQRIEWEPQPATGINADAIMSGFPGDPSESKDAKAFVEEMLADGQWMASKTLIAEARAIGINPNTLQGAMRRLGVEKKRIGFGSSGVWNSRLPRSSRDAID